MWYRISQFFSIILLIIFLADGGTSQVKNYAIQVAAVEKQEDAQSVVRDLKAKGLEGYLVSAEIAGLGTRYRIRIGQFKSSAEARSFAERLKKRGLIEDFFIAVYEAPAVIATRQRRVREISGKPSSNQLTQNRADETAEHIRTQPTAGSVEALPVENSPTRASHPEPVPLELKPVAALQESAGMAEIAPRISGPPVADALPDLNIKNSKWRAEEVSAMSSHNLRAIYFNDALTGWVAGENGALFRTTDGGLSWKPMISGTTADLTKIHFIDWNTGWIIGHPDTYGSDFAGSESDKILLMTNDGGNSWRQKRLSNVSALFFIDARTGWAVGRNGTLLKTADGGDEWEPIPDLEKIIGLPVESTTYNFGFNDVSFLDADHGWMIGNFYGRERNNIGGLFFTSDGGRSWKRIALTLQTQYASGRFTPGLLHSVHFSDLNTGTVTGEMMDGAGRFFFVLHTRDGGRNWQQFRTPSNATHSTQFTDLQNGWTAAFAPREGSADAVIYDTALMKTDNGGMSWQNEFLARGIRVRSIFFISPGRGWAVGDRGLIMKYESKK